MGGGGPKVFFQKPYRIILGPPKHVLHLVWSVLGIYTAIITALKVAPTGSSKWSINGKVKSEGFVSVDAKITYLHF